jgi:hypothetical protein
MMFKKKPADQKKRIALLLSAGIFLFSSCQISEIFELRQAEEELPGPGTEPAAIAEPAPEPETLPAQETEIETEPETEEPEPEPEPEPFRPVIPTEEREVSSEAADWIANFEAAFGEGAADGTILTEEEIDAYNKRMTESCPTLTDIRSIPETTDGTALKERIAAHYFPQGEKYDRGGSRIDDEMREAILANRALEDIGDTVSVTPAVITARCDMRSFPTTLGFYDSGDTFYSRIQETELIVGMPVWVLHRSADERFLYVRSYYYEGWITASAAAVCDRETFLTFCEPEVFITVTAPRVDAGHTTLDMGVVLPCVAEDEEAYTAILPMREAGGAYAEGQVRVPKTEAYPGYLPYTMRNYYAQAFSYLGTQYGWGGADGGIDCSGFVCAVFRTFGIMLPRDTQEQKDYAGQVTYTENYGWADKDALLTSLKSPAALFSPGHVMLYLGKGTDGMHYVIHAPKGGDYVKVAVFDVNRQLTSVVTLQ